MDVEVIVKRMPSACGDGDIYAVLLRAAGAVFSSSHKTTR
jgi:hypothetical protein